MGSPRSAKVVKTPLLPVILLLFLFTGAFATPGANCADSVKPPPGTRSDTITTVPFEKAAASEGQFSTHDGAIIIGLVVVTLALVWVNAVRRRALRRLAESEAKLRAVLESAPDYIATLALDGTIQYLNRVAPGSVMSKVIGRNAVDFLPPEHRRKFTEVVERIVSTGKSEALEIESRLADGTPAWFSCRISPVVSDGETVGLSGAATDITMARQRDEALRLSEERYRTVVESAGEAIFTLDREGTLLFLNTPGAEALGGRPEHFIGKSLWAAFPDSADRFMTYVHRVFASGEGEVVEETASLLGRKALFLTSLQPLRDAAGAVVAVLGVARDITHAVETQKQLESERVFARALMETANSMILCLDKEAHITVFNRECEKVTGYSRDEVIGKSWPELFLPMEARHDGFRNFADWVRRHPSDTAEGAIVTRFGQTRTILWSNSALFDPDGENLVAIAVGHDITERKRADIHQRARFKLLDDLRATITVDDSLHAGCQAIHNAQLFRRAVLTLHGDRREITALGQVGLDERLVATARKAPAPDETLARQLTQEKYRLSHSYFVPEEAALGVEGSPRYIPPAIDSKTPGPSWKAGDELFVPVMGDDLKFKGWLSVDTPFSGERPTIETVQFLEEIVDIVTQKVREIEVLERLREEHAALQHGEEKYRLLVENVRAGISLIDYEGRFLFINEIGARSLGKSVGEVVGHSMWEFFPREGADSHMAKIRKVIASDQEVIGETRAFVGGAWRWYDSSSRPFRDSHGKITAAFAIATDITERRQAQEDLARSEKRFRELADLLPQTLFEVDVEGNLTFSNRFALESFGYTQHDVDTGINVLQLTVPSDKERLMANVGRRLRGEPSDTHEYTAVRKDGSTFPVLIYSDPIIHDGRTVGLRGVLIDITDRKRAEDTLRYRSELEQLVATISTRFIDLPSDKTDDGFNQTLRAVGTFAGVDRSYVFLVSEDGARCGNTHEWCADGIEPQIRNLMDINISDFPWMAEKLGRAEDIYLPSLNDLPPEAESFKKHLEAQSIQSVLTVPMIYSHRLIGFLGFDAVRAKKQWLQEDIMLLRLVGEIFVNALQRKRAEAEVQRINQEKINQAREIAGGFAHEIRNSLFPARGALAKLSELRNTPSVERDLVEKYREIAERSIARAVDMTQLITRFTRLDSEYMPESVDLGQVIREVIAANQLRLDEHRITVNLDVGLEASVPVASNRRQLYSAVNNLVLNSIDALTKATNPAIFIRCYSGAGSVRFRISDNGSGIAPENLARVFDSFFSTKPGTGTGLGLGITKKIIEMYGGTISVSSTTNQGTVFEIELKPFASAS